MATSSPLPAVQTAVKITGPGTVALNKAAPLPVLDPSEILVRVACVSINPVDGKSAEMAPSPGATSGVDFSGIVVALGADVGTDEFRAATKIRPPSIGDRVFSCAFGNNPLRRDNGAFAEYVAAPARLVWHVPEAMDLVTAATLGTAVATAGLALFQYLQLPMPSNTSAGSANPAGSDSDPVLSHAKGNNTVEGPFVLVYGGGTSTGATAIQVLKLAGFTPITTCSPASAARATRLGAAATFDYRSPTCGADVRSHTSSSLTLALDCITDTTSTSTCYEALGAAGGRYLALDPFAVRCHTRRSVAPDWMFVCSMFGQAIPWASPFDWDARLRDREFAEVWFTVAQGLLDAGEIEAHPREILSTIYVVS
ncbi:chaperonin 10-like protein [Phialemonium atrogriseum]|uniref:Chaperonin 10-like protein n=1 Tax=Phialemonium atrogriseum TaxID=1093897 RepID=A0AAJ0CAY9_9PEZI|nr:chaperonin 10-like protein [Phialemonium atrogriseum]KAK1771952.1 chaperonin 10-like protein [Phialemonium atrogriseum]